MLATFRKFLFMMLLFCSFPHQALAYLPSSKALDSKNYFPFMTVTLGPDFIDTNNTQILTSIPPFQNRYVSTHSGITTVDGGIFIGLEHMMLNRIFSTQLGVAGYFDSRITPQGNIWLFNTPVFTDLSYKYVINHSRVMFTGKILTHIKCYPSIHPYVSWDIGSAFNRVSKYQETALISGIIPSSPFSNHHQTSLTYAAGLGLDYDVGSRFRVGIGYQYADLGAASLGPIPNALNSQTLNLSNLYTQQFRVQLTVFK